MRWRCTNPNNKDYASYGGRGITVCDRWQKLENFLADMGMPPDGFTIERRDVNGNYTPENCIWASQEVQQNNRRNNVKLTIGEKTLSMAQWEREVGVSQHCIRKRLARGWSHHEAVFGKTK
jgi:lambda repressor-like predicted transcriptional regulator